MLDGLPERPYQVNLGDALHIDAEGSVTYVSPVQLQADRGAPSDQEQPMSKATAEGLAEEING
jgi:hypothetical protein